MDNKVATLVEGTPTQDRPSPADVAAPPSSNSSVKVVVILLLLAIVAAAGTWVYFHYRDRVSSDDAQVDGHISAVASKVAGNVTEVLVLDNQAPLRVGAGLSRQRCWGHWA